MIIDKLENIWKYPSIPRVESIMRFLHCNDAPKLPAGSIPICGEDLYVKVQHYVPQAAEKNRFEVHKLYADVQVMVEGVELMQTAPFDALRQGPTCHPEEDADFYANADYISDLIVTAGYFVVFFPLEAHKPGCSHEKSDTPISKLVFKTVC